MATVTERRATRLRRRRRLAAIRSARPEDADRVRRFLAGLSPDSAYRRFFAAGRLPEALLRQLLRCDDGHEAALLVRGGEVVALANWAAYGDDSRDVELAVVVADAWQGRGLGPRVARAALDRAARHGATAVRATVLADNTPAIHAIRRGWPQARPVVDGDVFEYRLPISRAG